MANDDHYPDFLEAHPPLMDNADVFPPQRSGYEIVGTMQITGADMNRVADKDYPWKDYSQKSDPAYKAKVKKILAQRDKEVAGYTVTRRRYWARLDRYQYGVDTDVTITKHQGYVHRTDHSVQKTTSTTERLSFELGLDISPEGAAAPGEVPPVPPVMALAAAGNEGGGGGGGGASKNLDFQFSREMTESLHITDADETTYTDETTTTTQQKFVGGTTYIHWQLKEECLIERLRKPSNKVDPDPVSLVQAGTPIDYTDRFPKSSDGDIH